MSQDAADQRTAMVAALGEIANDMAEHGMTVSSMRLNAIIGDLARSAATVSPAPRRDDTTAAAEKVAALTLHVVRWAAQECEWQQSGEKSVAWMVEGWLYAHQRRSREIDIFDVLALGRIVEPRKNTGVRQVGVRVGASVKMPHDLVPAALDQLIGAQDYWDPTEWFRVYEEIHPFRDGNGRTGNILYNWLNGTLSEPIFPPNLWADERRDLSEATP